MKRNPRIAIAQIKYFDLDEKHNLEKIIYFIKKAKEKKVDIVCFPETCILKDKWLEFNHHFLNEIKNEYKKINLYSERGVNPGRKVHIFQTDFAKIGIAICWDLAFPEIFQKMKKSGV